MSIPRHVTGGIRNEPLVEGKAGKGDCQSLLSSRRFESFGHIFTLRSVKNVVGLAEKVREWLIETPWRCHENTPERE